MSRGFYQHQSSPNSKRRGNMEVNTAGQFQSPALLQTSPIDPTGLSSTRVGKMTMHAPALVQQFTHLVHSNRPHRPSYLLRKIACIREEKYNIKQTKQANSTCDNTSSLQKSNDFTVDQSRSNCLFFPVDHAVIPCCCRFCVGLANYS